MNLSREDRLALERLRQRFLAGPTSEQPYWQDIRQLELYHQTFAQRIGWKWRAVLDELTELGWRMPSGASLFDLGCGSGIATEIVLERFGTVAEVMLADHSVLAAEYATARLEACFPQVRFRPVTEWKIPAGSVVLISHVLTELSGEILGRLAEQIQHARAVLVVEPGTRAASAQVIALREMLRSHFAIVAPCPHRLRCGMLDVGNRQHWCHFHVRPPQEAFTDRQWARFADAFGVDIGDLAISMLVLDRQWNTPSPGSERIIGAMDIGRQDIALTVCSADGSICRRRVDRHHHREHYRRLRKQLPRWFEHEQPGHR